MYAIIKTEIVNGYGKTLVYVNPDRQSEKRSKNLKKSIIFAVLALVLICAVGCAPVADWDNVTNQTVVAKINGEEYKYELLNYSYQQKSIATKISKEISQGEDSIEISENKDGMNDALNRLMGNAALSAVAQSEGKGMTESDAAALAESTLIDSVTRYDYMREYLAQMLLALDTTEKELVETASVEMRLAADAETVAAELLGEIKEEKHEADSAQLAEELAERLEETVKSISVENVMTGEKDVCPNFKVFAEEIVLLNK
jgi:hypothetical protein